MIRRDGVRWTVAVDGRAVHVADRVGMGYLAELLTRPGEPVPALSLASEGRAIGNAPRQDLLDEDARTAYLTRTRELTAELAEAEADNDIGRAERLRVELDALVDQVEAATGLSGRPRSFGDDAERARTAVRKAIARAVEVIDEADPVIADLLRSSVTTGTTCTYAPPTQDPVVWSRAEPDQDGTTIGERRREASRRCIVGRTDEVDLVRSALAAEDAPHPILYVHGPGGVGKTTLLQILAEVAADADLRVAHIDMHTVESSPTAFLARVADELGAAEPQLTEEMLANYGRILVLVDSLERAAPLEDWLRERFVTSLPAEALVVVASRQPPGPSWSTDPGWRDLLKVVALGDLRPDEARSYLDLQGVANHLHDRLLELTHGHPLALSLVVDVLRQQPDADLAAFEIVDAPDVVGMLMERFVGEVPDPRHRAALGICASARFTTEDMLRSALGGDDASKLFAWLRSRSFIEEGRYGLFPHDLARDVLDSDLRWRGPATYRRLHARVREHLWQRLMATSGRERDRAAADIIYMHRRHTVLRPLLTWTDLDQIYSDRVAQGDVAELLAAVERHQGPTQAALVRHWLRCQPDAFVVFRRGEQEAVGFTAFLRLHEAELDEIARDPGALAMWNYTMRHDPPRPGEPITAMRFFVDRAANQAPASPSWTGFVMAHARQIWGRGLTWDFIGGFTSPSVEPAFNHIDYHRVPDAEYEVDARHHYVFAHDWRRVGIDEWNRIVGPRELPDG